MIFCLSFSALILCGGLFRSSIAEDLREIKREEALSSNHSHATRRVSGVPMDSRRARVDYLRGKLASRQAKFLSATGDDQVRCCWPNDGGRTHRLTYSFTDAVCVLHCVDRAHHVELHDVLCG